MQDLTYAQSISGRAAGEHAADATAVDAVLTASRSLIAVADRRAVLVSATAAGRLVVDQATARRRTLIEDTMAELPAGTQASAREGR